MFLRWLLAALHILAFGIGMAAIWARSKALKAQPLDRPALKYIFKADSMWGLAAALWLLTGSPRAIGAFEKGSAYYFSNPLFHAKLSLFALVVILEMWPMLTLMKWRRQVGSGGSVDTSRAHTLARISTAQAHIIVVIVLLATALARGVGAR